MSFRPIWTSAHNVAYDRGLRLGMTPEHAIEYAWECYFERKYPFQPRGTEP